MASSEEVRNENMRKFDTGATRNADTERTDPEGFLAPSVLESYFDYMHKNRVQKNGQLRDSDNWQLGIPQRAYMKSFWRHFFDLWARHRKNENNAQEGQELHTTRSRYQDPEIIEDCCALMFNVMGYLFEELKRPMKGEIMGKLNEELTGMATDLNAHMRNQLEGYRNAKVVSGILKSPMLKAQLAEDIAEPILEDDFGKSHGWGV